MPGTRNTPKTRKTAWHKCKAADATPSTPTAKRRKTTSSTRTTATGNRPETALPTTATVSLPENGPRPLTTADIPTIMNVVLEARQSMHDDGQPDNAPADPPQDSTTPSGNNIQTPHKDATDFGLAEQDATHLNDSTRRYLNEGLFEATRQTYSTGKQSYTSFCISTRNRILPATESTLLLFVSHLASRKISHTTINVHLAAVCHVHVIVGLHRSFEEQLTPRLQLVLKGIKKTQAISNIGRTHLPITLQIMSGIKDCLSRQPHLRYNIMLWAAC